MVVMVVVMVELTARCGSCEAICLFTLPPARRSRTSVGFHSAPGLEQDFIDLKLRVPAAQ